MSDITGIYYNGETAAIEHKGDPWYDESTEVVVSGVTPEVFNGTWPVVRCRVAACIVTMPDPGVEYESGGTVTNV